MVLLIIFRYFVCNNEKYPTHSLAFHIYVYWNNFNDRTIIPNNEWNFDDLLIKMHAVEQEMIKILLIVAINLGYKKFVDTLISLLMKLSSPITFKDLLSVFSRVEPQSTNF